MTTAKTLVEQIERLIDARLTAHIARSSRNRDAVRRESHKLEVMLHNVLRRPDQPRRED